MTDKRHIAILGSTGSIGRQALDVVRQHKDRFEVELLTANNSSELLIRQALEFMPANVVICNESKYQEVADALQPHDIKVFAGMDSVCALVRSEDIDIVPPEQGQLIGTVTSVTFKGMMYDIIVDFRGFKWLIQTTDYSPEGASIGIKIDPDGIHIMKKSHYSGMFGDYSSFSEEYDELDVPVVDPEEEESDDEE